MRVAIVGRTPGALVVLKPAGLASELPRDADADSLLRRLASAGHVDLRLVHRLDAAACGLMLVARSAAAAAYYSREIEARRWRKWYVARVSVPVAVAGRLVGPHQAYLKSDGRVATVVRSGGKPSFLDVALATPVPEGGGREPPAHRTPHRTLPPDPRHARRPRGAALGDATYGGPGVDPLYLEQVVLAGYADTTGAWTAWQAPPHADRDRWAPELTAAVDDRASRARTAPPPRDPGP